MPGIFKALASITVWVLFIFGLIAIVANFIMGIIVGEYFNPAKVPSAEMGLFAAIGVATLFLSVGAMKLRRMLE